MIAAMNALKLAAVHVLTLVTFLLLDAVWLGLVAREMYRREIGHLLAPKVRWGAAVAFYVLYIAGLLLLVVLPNQRSPWVLTAGLGAAFGLVAYATYDLTNLATLVRWPISVTLADLAWGAFATAIAAAAGRGYARWLLP
jgi:uncharacterized membrane protein